ncbi:MAG: divalent-cation tolerance protein CutA [Kiritimatiellales bacterium]|nr:divalent-cation tolerance protein CutA [Kiritimatiellota bacterium]MBL7012126.1 divalent-cation tolerance protein CutA [Kiritimatiellales bacterium]
MNTKLIYVTAPSLTDAEQIAETVVNEKLAACANFFDGVHSIFEWNGQLCREDEAVLILKATADRVAELTDRIKQLHTYDCPCIVVLPIEGGNPEFLNWVEASTRSHNPEVSTSH